MRLHLQTRWILPPSALRVRLPGPCQHGCVSNMHVQNVCMHLKPSKAHLEVWGSLCRAAVQNRVAVAQCCSSEGPTLAMGRIAMVDVCVCVCADVSVPEVAVQRMKLDERRIDALIEGIKQVADSEDPVGKTLSRTEICQVLSLHALYVEIAETVIGLVCGAGRGRPSAPAPWDTDTQASQGD